MTTIDNEEHSTSMRSSRDDVSRAIVREYGVCIGSRRLRKLLGFDSVRAFGYAVRKGHIPLNFFQLKGRRGRYVLATEVAGWLTTESVGRPWKGQALKHLKEIQMEGSEM